MPSPLPHHAENVGPPAAPNDDEQRAMIGDSGFDAPTSMTGKLRPSLRFEQVQRENEYLNWRLRQDRRRAQWALVGVAIAVILLSIVVYARATTQIGTPALALQGVLLPAVLLLTAALIHRGDYVWFERCMLAAAGFAVTCMVLLRAYAIQLGTPLPYESMLVVVFFLLLLAGLRVRIALAAAWGAVSAYLIAVSVAGIDANDILRQGLNLLTLTALGSAGTIFNEDLSRRTFSEASALSTEANIDALTGLPNRRATERSFDTAWRLAYRGKDTVTVLFIDIDFFKRLNDSDGHAAGDAALVRVAGALNDAMRRPLDTIGRIGGEEFVAIAFGLDLAGMGGLADKLRAAIAAEAVPHPDSDLGDTITVSIGGAQLVPNVRDPSLHLWEQADKLLYEAKNAGRDRAVCREVTQMI